MRRLIVRIFISLFLIVIVLILAQVSRFYVYLKRVDYSSIKPFTQTHPHSKLNILFLGDSTAVGVGLKSNKESVAGFFGKHYPYAWIDNKSQNGLKVADLLQTYDFKPNRHYQLAVILCGGNDILRFTSLDSLHADLRRLLFKANSIADHVVILHSGNVGLAPLFIWPFSDVLSARTRAVRSLFQQVALEFNAIYIDLYQKRSDDPLNKNIDLSYSLDYLHPSGHGYYFWFKRIQMGLNQAGIKL